MARCCVLVHSQDASCRAIAREVGDGMKEEARVLTCLSPALHFARLVGAATNCRPQPFLPFFPLSASEHGFSPCPPYATRPLPITPKQHPSLAAQRISASKWGSRISLCSAMPSGKCPIAFTSPRSRSYHCLGALQSRSRSMAAFRAAMSQFQLTSRSGTRLSLTFASRDRQLGLERSPSGTTPLRPPVSTTSAQDTKSSGSTRNARKRRRTPSSALCRPATARLRISSLIISRPPPTVSPMPPPQASYDY